MREVRIYQPGSYQAGQLRTLDAQASQHVAVVLRMKVGQRITLFPGNNTVFYTTVVAITKKSVTVQIESEAFLSLESPCEIHLAQAISKGERMSFVIQKAVELGVTSITPLQTKQSVVKLDLERLKKKTLQWQAIAVSACEQCGRNQIPRIHAAKSFPSYLSENNDAIKFLLHPNDSKKLKAYPRPNRSSISLLIGPEGGFDPEEIIQAKAAGYQPLSLGPRILRTETAALTAISLLQATYGDL